jgi:hypothetical protein
VSYTLTVRGPAPPAWRALLAAVALPDVRVVDEPADEAWPTAGLQVFREGLSTRATEVAWQAGDLTIVIQTFASPDDCELGLQLADAAAGLLTDGNGGAARAVIGTDYFGDVTRPELRRLHGADWIHEQAVSAVDAMAGLIRERNGPVAIPGPRRFAYVGPRLLTELETAGPPPQLPDRVLAAIRRVQWGIPAGFRDAGVFASRGEAAQGRETHFAIWLAEQDLLIPYVDYVALRASQGEVVMVPFAAVPTLAGDHATLIDECQLTIRAVAAEAWPALVARARALVGSART